MFDMPPGLFSASPGLVFPVLFTGLSLWFAGVRRLARARQGERVAEAAGPLTPSMASLFGVLLSFTIATELAQLRSAQANVSREAASAATLAWASTTPGVDGAPVREALAVYLSSTIEREWSGGPASLEVSKALRELERRTRAAATAQGAPSAASGELLRALDDLAVARRERINQANSSVPMGYLAVLVVGCAVLLATYAQLSAHLGRRTYGLAAGPVLLLASGLTLLVGVSAPYSGPFGVSHASVDQLVVYLQDGFFNP